MTQACEGVEFRQPLLANVKLVKVVTWIVKVVTWICQSCSMYFSPFAKQNHAEVWGLGSVVSKAIFKFLDFLLL